MPHLLYPSLVLSIGNRLGTQVPGGQSQDPNSAVVSLSHQVYQILYQTKVRSHQPAKCALQYSNMQ